MAGPLEGRGRPRCNTRMIYSLQLQLHHTDTAVGSRFCEITKLLPCIPPQRQWDVCAEMRSPWIPPSWTCAPGKDLLSTCPRNLFMSHFLSFFSLRLLAWRNCLPSTKFLRCICFSAKLRFIRKKKSFVLKLTLVFENSSLNPWKKSLFYIKEFLSCSNKT